MEDQDTTNSISHGKQYHPSGAKLLENDFEASTRSLLQNFQCYELNLERSEVQCANMGVDPPSSEIKFEEQGLKAASANAEAKGTVIQQIHIIGQIAHYIDSLYQNLGRPTFFYIKKLFHFHRPRQYPAIENA